MLVSFVYVVACRLFAFVVLLAREDRSKELELLVLRHELSILRRQRRRPPLTERDRLVLTVLSRVMPRRFCPAFRVTPETLLRWHRRIVARSWTNSHRRPGRPPLDQQVRQLILRLARENGHWGYMRIVGELLKLGITVSATLVRKRARTRRRTARPERGASSWRAFLRQHGAIAAVHWKNGLWITSGGSEYPLVIAAVACAVAAIGPGSLSLDRVFGIDWAASTRRSRRRPSEQWAG